LPLAAKAALERAREEALSPRGTSHTSDRGVSVRNRLFYFNSCVILALCVLMCLCVHVCVPHRCCEGPERCHH